MKDRVTASLFLFLGLSFHATAFSQSYYPLQTGNTWFYRAVGQFDSTVTISVRVLGDSLFSNGHRYSVLSQNDIMEQRFVRADSTSVYYFTGEDQRVFKLDAQVGDTTALNWGPYAFIRLSGIDTFEVFGLQDRVLTYELDGIMYAQLRLSERYGPMTEWRYPDPPPPWPEWGREMLGCIIDSIHHGITLSVHDDLNLQTVFTLYQNFPNPFNPATTIRFELPTATFVSLKIFDMLGKEVSTLETGEFPAGTHFRQWNAAGFSSGVYFYRLIADGHTQTRRMHLVR